MGTRRKVAVWYLRRRGEYVIADYPGKPKNLDCVFNSQNDMVEFARSAGLILKERDSNDGTHGNRPVHRGNSHRRMDGLHAGF